MAPDKTIEAELWQAFRQKDKNAFEEIFKLHYESLYLYGYKFCKDKELLEDLIQELFTDLWTSSSVTEVKSVRAYLLKSLQYKIYKRLKENSSVVPFDSFSYLNFEVSKETLLVQQQENDERNQRIFQCFDKLSTRQREIIYLRFYRGFSYEEISSIMEINYQAARNLLSHSLKALRPLLEKAVHASFVLIYLSSVCYFF